MINIKNKDKWPNLEANAWYSNDPIFKEMFEHERVVSITHARFNDRNAAQTRKFELKENGMPVSTLSVNIELNPNVLEKIGKDELYIVPNKKWAGETEIGFLKRIGFIQEHPIASVQSGFITYQVYKLAPYFARAVKNHSTIEI